MGDFVHDTLDLCDAVIVPASCERDRYGHQCDHPDGHDDPHECACGHQWSEPDR